MYKGEITKPPLLHQNQFERAAFWALAGCIAVGQVSIAASQILLAAALLATAVSIWKRNVNFLPGKQVLLPLCAFMVWTIIAALASPNILLGLTIIKKFYLYLLILLVPIIVKVHGRATLIYRALFAVAVISSLRGLGQFIADPNRDLLHRISGFMSQWMTYSGLLMLVLVLLVAYALFHGLRSLIWVLPVIIFVSLALVFSQTRSSWMGAIAGVFILVLLRRPRAVPGLLAIILASYFLLPPAMKQRLGSGLDPADPNTRNRIELIETSLRIIKAHPWLGAGPRNVKYEAPKYRTQSSSDIIGPAVFLRQFLIDSNSGKPFEYPDWMYQHMHNNPLQIAAETGIPGLLLWLWLMVRLAWDALQTYRCAVSSSFLDREKTKREILMVSCGALGAWVALLIAGMFEYNFGDSEVLTLFLFIVSAPYACHAIAPALQKPGAVTKPEVEIC
jgi:putative inorganic carbon (hco3(-)) transporter